MLPDTIFVFGNIGLAVNTIDQITDQHFNFGIYSANLLLDAEFIYSMQYNEINWENASDIYTERSYALERSGFGKFYHLFSNHGNQELPFINAKSRPGYIFDKKVPHDAIIDIQDYANNKIEIRAYFVSDTLPRFDYSTDFQDDRCTVTFNENKRVRPYFFRTGTDSKDQTISADFIDMGNNIYLIENLIPPFNVLQISAKNKIGVSSPTTFHMKPKQDFQNIKGKFKIKHYEHGIIISFKEKQFSGLEAYISIKKAGILYAHALHRDSKLTLSSHLLSPMTLKDVTEIKVYYESSTPYEIFPMDLDGGIVYPDSSFHIGLFENQLTLSGDAYTFYDTTYIWAHPVTTSLPKEGNIISGPFYLHPYIIPFNNEMQLNIAIESIQSTKNLGIYFYNQKKFRIERMTNQE